MADQGTIDVIREALRDSDRVDSARIELVIDDGAVVLRGSVATAGEADVAAMVAEQHAEAVRNQLSVDGGVRDDTPDGQAVAADADYLTTDAAEALGENVPWDPPDQPSSGRPSGG